MSAAATPLVERHTLFESPWLQVGHVAVRPTSSACGEIEVAAHHAVALPLAGVFARHDGPRRQVIATPQHALIIRAGRPYRLSFPGCIGDRCLVLRLSPQALESALPEELGSAGFGSAAFVDHLPLPAALVLARGRFWRCVAAGDADALQAEELGLELIAQVLRAARVRGSGRGTARGGTSATRAGLRIRPVQRAIEAIAARPAQRWTVAALAAQASVSPGHLARSFHAEMGLTIHGYVMRSRLSNALEAVLDSDAGLTEIGLEAGFSSHSHFTARFRALFGHTPLELRRGLSRAGRARELRRIMTAQRMAAT